MNFEDEKFDFLVFVKAGKFFLKKIPILFLPLLQKGQSGENDKLIATSIADALKLEEDT